MPDPRLAAITKVLRAIIDPETGRDLVAMGLIYDIAITGDRAEVVMTTTTRGCPLTEMLRFGAETAVLAVPGIHAADVRLSWEPHWTPDRMEPL